MVWPFKRQDPSEFLPLASPGNTPPTTPQYVPVEQFNDALNSVKELGSKFDTFQGLVTAAFTGGGQQQRQAPTAPVRAPEPEIPDITDDEYADAVLRGDAAKLAIRTEAVAQRRVREVEQRLGQRIGQLETHGMAVLEQVTGEVGQSSLAKMPYYQLLKGEIDGMLESLPAFQRTPAMREHCYEAVVGKNVDKVMTFRQQEQARIAQEREALGVPGRTAGQQDDTPTGASVFGDVIKNGATWQGSGQLWGRKSPNEWAKSRYGVESIDQAAVYATNVMGISDCPQCFGPIVGGKCHCRKGS